MAHDRLLTLLPTMSTFPRSVSQPCHPPPALSASPIRKLALHPLDHTRARSASCRWPVDLLMGEKSPPVSRLTHPGYPAIADLHHPSTVQLSDFHSHYTMKTPKMPGQLSNHS